VSGGWFDAGGGYEKFAYTASYADGLLEIAQRDFPGRYPTLGPEAAFGLSWLRKLWDPARKVLYIQVGNGNASNTIQGDYNFWFLPQAEDRLSVTKGGNPGPSAYYVKYRPVFEAAAPGRHISPEFAGRLAADFGLAAQLGATFPHCMQSEIANLAGSLTGTGALQLGAVTDGPSSPANFAGLGTVTGMRACRAGDFGPLNTRTAQYEDNVVAWPSVEPADDYTASSLLAFAFAAARG
jgi:hypothetical protein